MDARSDTYSLSVLFHELLYLRHYLEGQETLAEVLAGVEKQQPNLFDLESNPYQPPVPAELAWFLHKGFAKDPAQRSSTVEEIGQVLRGAEREGRIHVRCQRTLVSAASTRPSAGWTSTPALHHHGEHGGRGGHCSPPLGPFARWRP